MRPPLRFCERDLVICGPTEAGIVSVGRFGRHSTEFGERLMHYLRKLLVPIAEGMRLGARVRVQIRQSCGEASGIAQPPHRPEESRNLVPTRNAWGRQNGGTGNEVGDHLASAVHPSSRYALPIPVATFNAVLSRCRFRVRIRLGSLIIRHASGTGVCHRPRHSACGLWLPA